jgi:enoyl-CoA hydratase
MAYRCFDLEITDHVAHVRMTRGDELNTMVPEFWSELPQIVDGISAEASARVIVLSSTGKHFCAGMDLSVFAGSQRPAAEPGRVNARFRSMVRLLQHTASCLEKARMPVLAAVQGGCIGGAVDLVTAADCRYATRDAFFTVQEITIGMTADIGTLQRLGKIVPEGVARELAYTGRRMSGERAFEVGLVQALYDDHDSLVKGTLETAAEIASKSPLAVHGTKVAMNYARDHSVEDSLEQIATWQAGMFQEGELREAFTAKLENRETQWTELLPEPTRLDSL